MSIQAILSFFGLYDERKKIPSPRHDHQIGTKQFPYKVKNTDKMRRRAMKSGIHELEQIFMMTLSAKEALAEAVNAKRKRLILIRTLHKNKVSCETIHSDVLWLYDNYKLNKANLKFECSFRA